jgi:putative YhdH/YhfP family quinone oxidoreductase
MSALQPEIFFRDMASDTILFPRHPDMDSNSIRCFYVNRDSTGNVSAEVTSRPESEWPRGDVTIAVEYSSLNYKDALAASGHPGVAPTLPHVPGIDAVGTVIQGNGTFKDGDRVIVTGYEFGAKHWGGWSERIRVPHQWVVPLPATLSMRDAMILGTAGFTAAQCVRELIRNEVGATDKPIIVTGATGGVGSIAVCLLAKLGFQVTGMTGKSNSHEWLSELGATNVVNRSILDGDDSRPMWAARFAGAVDTVGGLTLVRLLKSVDVNGCIAACGMVGGTELSLSVYPFILRGVRLAGITSALCPMHERLTIWERLAGPWKLDRLDRLVQEVTLKELQSQIARIMQGGIQGRVIVKVAS